MLDRTLTAWRKAGVLSGDEYAALRSTLRDAADAVDTSRALLREGQVSPFSHARTVALYREALMDAAGGVDRGGDPFEDELRTLLRNAPDL
jgi:hypothetical protein